MKIPLYKSIKNPKNGQKLVIDSSTASIRPHCVAAVLRNVTFTKERYSCFTYSFVLFYIFLKKIGGRTAGELVPVGIKTTIIFVCF